MRIRTLTATAILTAAAWSLPLPSACAQSSEAAASQHIEAGVSLVQLITAVARKSGKRFVIDPRVRAEVVLIGQDGAALSFNELLVVLRDYGFAAIEYGGLVHVVPDTAIKTLPIPTISGKETRPDGEWVSKVITVRNASAAQLVPILRPLVHQAGGLVAYPCNNRLIVVDSFANVRRLETLIESLDVGEPYKPWPGCGGQESTKQ